MHTLRLARDFLIGLGLFMLISSLNLATGAPPEPLAFVSAVRTSVLAALIDMGACWQSAESAIALLPNALVEHDRTLVILGLVFSGMVAFNLWFARHVRCVYTPQDRLGGPAGDGRQVSSAPSAFPILGEDIRLRSGEDKR
jgi:hypothetical protein